MLFRSHQGAGQVDLLAHAGRVVGHEGGAGLPQAQDMEELGGAGDDDVAPQTAQKAGVGDSKSPVLDISTYRSSTPIISLGLVRHRLTVRRPRRGVSTCYATYR